MARPKKEDTENKLSETLNALASGLMSKVPNDIKSQADVFCREVATAVNVYVDESDKKVQDAENRAAAIESRMTGKDIEGEKYSIRDAVKAQGTFKMLFRASNTHRPLDCIHAKQSPQVDSCGSHCAGFEILPDGNVKICTGEIKQIGG